MDNWYEKELEKLEEGPKADIYLELLKGTLKKIPNSTTPGYDAIQGFWFLKKITFIHDRLALQLNKCLQ